MANELDLLMQRLSEDPSLATPEDIDTIITQQRKARANYESGVKPKKEGTSGVKLDLVALGLKKAPEPIKRRM